MTRTRETIDDIVIVSVCPVHDDDDEAGDRFDTRVE